KPSFGRSKLSFDGSKQKSFQTWPTKTAGWAHLKMEKMKGGTQRKDAMWLPSSYRADPWRRVNDLPRLGLG
ncbi:MAG: hypothetical protein ACFNO3_02835, partial [Alloprevotella tannerae]